MLNSNIVPQLRDLEANNKVGKDRRMVLAHMAASSSWLDKSLV